MHITSTLLVAVGYNFNYNCLIPCVMCEVEFAKGYRSHNPDFVPNIQHALFGIIGTFACEPPVSCTSTISRCNWQSVSQTTQSAATMVSGNKHGLVGLPSHVTGNEVASWLDNSWSHKIVSIRAHKISPVSPWSIPPQQRVPEKLLISKNWTFSKTRTKFWGKGIRRVKSGLALNRGALNRGFTVVMYNILAINQSLITS
jgi:hypothetical protein